MRIPNTPELDADFPARQTYSNGEVVNWNGAAERREPRADPLKLPLAATAPVRGRRPTRR